MILESVEQAEKQVGCKLLYGWYTKHLVAEDVVESLSRNKNVLTYRLGNTMTEFICTNEAVAEMVMRGLMPVKTSNSPYSGNGKYQNTNRYHGADVVLVDGDPISCKHWDKVYGHLATPSDQVTTVKPVSQTLDDTESWILETVQSAERLLLGTTAVSYWVKFPLAEKVSYWHL